MINHQLFATNPAEAEKTSGTTTGSTRSQVMKILLAHFNGLFSISSVVCVLNLSGQLQLFFRESDQFRFHSIQLVYWIAFEHISSYSLKIAECFALTCPCKALEPK